MLPSSCQQSGVQERLKEQENALLVMKSELLRAGFHQQRVDNENAELTTKLEERDRTILDLRVSSEHRVMVLG